MKKNLLLTSMVAMALSANAQYISKAPQGGFDFNTGKDYVVLYAPEVAIEKMGSNIKSNQNLDPEQKKNALQYWTCDWDKSQLTLYNVEEPDGKNSFGTSDYLNMTPLWTWGSGQFTGLSQKYDLSMLDDDYVLHLGLRDFGSKSCPVQIQVLPEQKDAYKLLVNKPLGSASGDYVGIGSIGHDKEWYFVDISLKELNDEDGDFGFIPDFKAAIKDNVFVIGYSCTDDDLSKYTYGAKDPITGLKEVNITELGAAVSLDAVFFYKPATDGVKTINAEESTTAVYDLQGRMVSSSTKGIAIIKTANGVKKVIL